MDKSFWDACVRTLVRYMDPHWRYPVWSFWYASAYYAPRSYDPYSRSQSVKTVIIEGLSHIGPAAFLSALDRLVKNNTYFFVTKLEQGVPRTESSRYQAWPFKALVHRKRKLINQDRTNHDVAAIRGILLFLTILWYNGSEGGIHHHTLSCFLVPLVDFVSSLREECSQSDYLLEPLLTGLAAFEWCRAGPTSNDAGNFRLWDYQTIWQLAVNSPSSDLMVACPLYSPVLFMSAIPDLSFPHCRCLCQPDSSHSPRPSMWRTLMCRGLELFERCGAPYHGTSLSEWRRTPCIGRLSDNIQWASVPSTPDGS